MTAWIADALIVLGLAVMTLGVYGIVRFPDVYTQLHASSKAPSWASRPCWPPPWAYLGRWRDIQYRRLTMGTNRRRQATTGLVVLAVVLGWLWAGGLAAPAAGSPADELTTSRSLLVLDPAVPPGRAPALRPSAERPDPGGRLVPLVLGLVVAALAAAFGPGTRRHRPGPVPVRSLLWSTHLEARAPPTLQPA